MQRDLVPGFIEELPPQLIHHPSHPLRKDLGDLVELTSSIRQQGLLEPIVVRPLDDGFEVVAGNRRLDACKKAGMRKISCNILYLSDKEAYEVSLIENVQHKTLDAIEEAEAFKSYVEEYGYGGESELASRIGKSQQYISQRMGLLRLPKDLLEKVTSRQVTPSHASELLGLDENQQKILAELIVGQKISTKTVRNLAKNLRAEQILDSPVDGIDSSSEYFNGYRLRQDKIARNNKVITKCIAFLRTSMIRLDEVIDVIDEDEWVLKEAMFNVRSLIHTQIDELIRLEKRFKIYPFENKNVNLVKNQRKLVIPDRTRKYRKEGIIS